MKKNNIRAINATNLLVHIMLFKKLHNNGT